MSPVEQKRCQCVTFRFSSRCVVVFVFVSVSVVVAIVVVVSLVVCRSLFAFIFGLRCHSVPPPPPLLPSHCIPLFQVTVCVCLCCCCFCSQLKFVTRKANFKFSLVCHYSVLRLRLRLGGGVEGTGSVINIYVEIAVRCPLNGLETWRIGETAKRSQQERQANFIISRE